ncbi:MAG: hypothetical protein IJ217_00215 [Clostridia bacterium]|nr:hypothetical protein [Clostridia bacterium]
METFKKVLKEIGIALLLLLLVAAVAAILFVDKIPFSKQIPESIHYTNIDKNDYNVRGDVEDIANDTVTFMSKASELKYYELIKLVLPGRHRPFGSINSGTDIPSEYVSGATAVVDEYYYYEDEPIDSNNGEPAANSGSDFSDPTAAMERDLQDQSYGEVDVNRLKGND